MQTMENDTASSFLKLASLKLVDEFKHREEGQIKKVNYLLRGLEIPNGKHKIEFKFMLPKYKSSGTWAMIGSLLLFVLLGFGIYSDWKKRKSLEV
jgi:uncharacterized membrane protein YfhO